MLPSLQVTAEDIGADKRLLARLASWCDRYTPWVALDDLPDQAGYGLFLDITGCAHLFGGGDSGETRLLEDLTARLEKVGFACRAGLADTAGAAWAMAHFDKGARGQRIVPPGGQRQALAELDIAALRLPADAIETLNRLGLRRIADLYSLPRAPLTNRFGPLVLARLDQALGRLVENIEPRRPAPPFRCRLAFAEPIGRPEDIAAATSRLLASLGSQLESAGVGARQIELVLYRVDGSFERCDIGTSQPSRDADHLLRLFAEPLGQIDAGFGVELMLLTARSVETFAGKQTSLQSGETEDGKVDELIDRLTSRLGSDRVIRLMPRQSHLPERAVQRISAGGGANGKAGLRSAVALAEDWRAFTQPTPGRTAPVRPVRLLSNPEPIDVIAPVPDDPPRQFNWRQQSHRVVRVDGPERLTNEWWREQETAGATLNATPPVRDYYRIEAEDGQRYWIYRDGPFNSISIGGASRTARWYLHGFCA
jgi:protein ImuB